ncbi:MAG: right-handed parallel beta-helix repeat-containing protein, partial [bacterium]
MKRQIFVSLVVLGLLAFKPIWAETYISGTITSSTTWVLADSPYVATDTVFVANGVILTIEPGVTVRFTTNTSLMCYGTLSAIGTPEGTITFTSDQATHTAGHWNGIKLSGSGANGSQIKYCDIGYAKQAVYLENVSGIVIINGYIHDNKGDNGGFPGSIGCGIYLSNSSNNIIGINTIKNNTGGQGGTGGWGGSGGSGGIGCGIYLYQSTNNIISENSISSNTGGQGGTGGLYGSGGLGGIGTGIYFSNSTNNTISQNTILTNTGGQRGIGGSAGGTAGNSGQGYGIYIEPNSFNNTITVTNTYNNEPIFYYYNQSGITIENQNLTLAGSGSTNLGRIVLTQCSNFTIRNNTISGGIGQNGITSNPGNLGSIGCGVYLGTSTNGTIINNTIFQNTGGQGGASGLWGGSGGSGGIGCGIYLLSSTNNIILENSISDNTGGKGGNGGNGDDSTPGGLGGLGGIGTGIYLSNSTNNTILNNTISNNQGGQGGTGGYKSSGGSGGIGCGIYLSNSIGNPISQNTISGNKGGNRGYGGGYGNYGQGYGIYSISSSNPEIHYNNLLGNKNGDLTKGYGVYHDGTSGTISATYNWWGHSSGPEHPVTNPSGQGDKVSDWVEYRPYLLGICTASSISVIPTSGPIGTIITVQGQNFATNSLISIDFGTHLTIAITTSNEYGSFSTTFIVDTQPSCTKIITASDEYGGTAIAHFKIQGAFITKLSPISGSVGSIITIEGVGFAGSSLSIDFGTMPTITTTMSSINGTFSTTFIVNTQPPCTKLITASDFKEIATMIFLLIPSPRITHLLPQSGLAGTIITIAGSGFGPNTLITIAFGTNQNITNTLSSALGFFLTTFIVDTQPVCTKIITASGDSCAGLVYATTTFKLIGIPGISLEKSGPEEALTLSTITYTLKYQ